VKLVVGSVAGPSLESWQIDDSLRYLSGGDGQGGHGVACCIRSVEYIHYELLKGFGEGFCTENTGPVRRKRQAMAIYIVDDNFFNRQKLSVRQYKDVKLRKKFNVF
jgi:hypothetical protein